MSLETFDVGDEIVLTARFRDPDTDELVEPDTVTVSVKAPDGTTSTPDVDVADSVYTASVVPDDDGMWFYTYRGTGDVQARATRKFRVRRLLA